MGLTKAERYNRNMDKIFARSEELGNHTLHGSTEKRKKVAKKMSKGFDYDGMMRDVYKQFPNIKIDGVSPYKDKHKR